MPHSKIGRFYGHKSRLRTNDIVSKKYLKKIKENYAKKGYPFPKWGVVAQSCLSMGLNVKRIPAKTTESNYLEITGFGKKLKVRFSTHKESLHRSHDLDIIVGGPNGISANEALEIIKDYYKDEKLF